METDSGYDGAVGGESSQRYCAVKAGLGFGVASSFLHALISPFHSKRRQNLRCCVIHDAPQEPWALRAHPELGFLTAIALGTEKTWLVVGTSRGFVMLWDLRFQVR